MLYIYENYYYYYYFLFEFKECEYLAIMDLGFKKNDVDCNQAKKTLTENFEEVRKFEFEVWTLSESVSFLLL